MLLGGSTVLLSECEIFEIFLMAIGRIGPTCIEYTCNVTYT